MDGGLCGTGVIGVYHVRRVVPLMAHALLMYQMTPDSSPKGTVIFEGALSIDEVERRILEATASTEGLDPVYSVPGHPAMKQRKEQARLDHRKQR